MQILTVSNPEQSITLAISPVDGSVVDGHEGYIGKSLTEAKLGLLSVMRYVDGTETHHTSANGHPTIFQAHMCNKADTLASDMVEARRVVDVYSIFDSFAASALGTPNDIGYEPLLQQWFLNSHDEYKVIIYFCPWCGEKLHV